MDYRAELFGNYDRRTARLDAPEAQKLEWFRAYAKRAYLPWLQGVSAQHAEVLDIGCSGGYLLRVLAENGFERLHGVDLSARDVERAQELAPSADVRCADAMEHLESYPSSYDIIILKAVLEHMPKEQVFPFLERIRSGLKPGGIVIVDVPNMDWLFASHERYMDFTHESGFTKESLRQVVSGVFPQVEVVPIQANGTRGVRRLLGSASRMMIVKLLKLADPEGASNPIWARSIIAVARK